jgi:hypothetical protein
MDKEVLDFKKADNYERFLCVGYSMIVGGGEG